MPNIIDGIRKLDKDQLCSLLASYEEVTLLKSVGDTGSTFVNKGVKFVNGAMNVLRVKKTIPELVSFEQRISKKTEELKALDYGVLQERMIFSLKDKVIAVLVSPPRDINSDEVLSECIIKLASRSFEIKGDLSVSQKADAIYNRYNERLISQTQKNYSKATPEQKKEIDDKLQAEIDAMSDEQKRELEKALQLNKITGKALGKMLASSAGAGTLLIALKCSGFGAYMALTTIIHAVFTTTLGITVPFSVYTASTSFLSFITGPVGWAIFGGIEAAVFAWNKNKIIYELLAQAVWMSVLAIGGKLTPKEESFPSWLPKNILDKLVTNPDELVELQEKYTNLIKEISDSKEKIEKAKEEIDSLNKQLSENKVKETEILEEKKTLFNDLKARENALNFAKNNVKHLEAELKTQKENQSLINEYKKNKRELDDIKAKYNQAQKLLAKTESELKRLNQFERNSNKKISGLQSNIKDLQKRTDELTQKNLYLKNEKNKLEQALSKEYRYQDIFYDEQILTKFINMLQIAKKEILIVSPWLNSYVKDKLIGYFINAAKRGVTIKIVYGIDNTSGNVNSGDRSSVSDEVIKEYKRALGSSLQFRKDNTHVKLCICDDTYLLGSYNFLSFWGNYYRDTRHEICFLCDDITTLNELKTEYFGEM